MWDRNKAKRLTARKCLHLLRSHYLHSLQVYSKAKQKQPPKGVPRKVCSENMLQIYRRAHMPKCEITLRHGCSPVNLLHIFRIRFPKTTSWWLLLVNLKLMFVLAFCVALIGYAILNGFVICLFRS